MSTKGDFTLPGESGYEQLTLRLAEKWGADVIRDSDGTKLSDEILEAGYGIYSTVCVIREHNAWAKMHSEMQQQSFLMAGPMVAQSSQLTIPLMESYYQEQFQINDSPESLAYWQVYDRTTEQEVPRERWSYDKASGSVRIDGCKAWHEYTVNFMAYRIWEEISMYNHVTNHWDKEHLMQLDPRHPAVQEYLLDWMETWCKEHPMTTVVRFTSLFYNFVWIWGSDLRRQNRYTDWGSYDFTVSPLALDEFQKAYGYRMTSEDFIHQGKLHVTHMPPEERQKDWMAFINRFVVDFGKKLIEIVHRYGKKAYVFYDDSWVGLEPYRDTFAQFQFDGLIKCVFSGYEARLCANVPGVVHELRLHPYLFPVGLGGAPTFTEGGNPALDAKKYWVSVRRALLRQTVDRIGLGGYLHLTEAFPDFQDTIEEIADEFRSIKKLHGAGGPVQLKAHVAVLHSWGKLRSWTLSGHFHETWMHNLIHINEALSGLPVEVSFIDFDEVRKGDLSKYQVIINAGRENDAWSGGDAWKDEEVVARLTAWAAAGGMLIGVGEPSAVEGFHRRFRMAQVLGVDLDRGERVCHGRYSFTVQEDPEGIVGKCQWRPKEGIYLTDGETQVYQADGNLPLVTEHPFGKGCGIYMSSFEKDIYSIRLLLNLLMKAGGQSWEDAWVTDNPAVEAAYFSEKNTLVMINNTAEKQKASINVHGQAAEAQLEPFGSAYLCL